MQVDIPGEPRASDVTQYAHTPNSRQSSGNKFPFPNRLPSMATSGAAPRHTIKKNCTFAPKLVCSLVIVCEIADLAFSFYLDKEPVRILSLASKGIVVVAATYGLYKFFRGQSITVARDNSNLEEAYEAVNKQVGQLEAQVTELQLQVIGESSIKQEESQIESKYRQVTNYFKQVLSALVAQTDNIENTCDKVDSKRVTKNTEKPPLSPAPEEKESKAEDKENVEEVIDPAPLINNFVAKLQRLIEIANSKTRFFRFKGSTSKTNDKKGSASSTPKEGNSASETQTDSSVQLDTITKRLSALSSNLSSHLGSNSLSKNTRTPPPDTTPRSQVYNPQDARGSLKMLAQSRRQSNVSNSSRGGAANSEQPHSPPSQVDTPNHNLFQ